MSAQIQNGLAIFAEDSQECPTAEMLFVWKLARGFVWGLGMIHLLFGGSLWFLFRDTPAAPFFYIVLGIGAFYVLFGVLSHWLPKFSLSMLACGSFLETTGTIVYYPWTTSFDLVGKVFLGFALL